jgi:pantothenate kinase
VVQTKVVASLQTLQPVVEAELSPLVELVRLQITAQLRAAHFKVEMVVLSVVPKAAVAVAEATSAAAVVRTKLQLLASTAVAVAVRVI